MNPEQYEEDIELDDPIVEDDTVDLDPEVDLDWDGEPGSMANYATEDDEAELVGPDEEIEEE